jgi:hypothetical protein
MIEKGNERRVREKRGFFFSLYEVYLSIGQFARGATQKNNALQVPQQLQHLPQNFWKAMLKALANCSIQSYT